MKLSLRSGYTTGACAAASAKAAILSLLTQSLVKDVEISLPIDKKVKFKIVECNFNENSAFCFVIKDAGDDPDVTNGIKIGAKIERAENSIKAPKLIIKGGIGVGVVTKPGLPVSVGGSAINPVPLKMIKESVFDILKDHSEENSCLYVTIVVPEGLKVSRRTLNERLGIVGGISILGTTGIVEPMSLAAYRSVIDTCLNIAIASDLKKVVFTPGRTTQRIAENYLKLDTDSYVQVGDHIGYSLEAALKVKFNDIIILGQLGKLSKIACGYFDTHAYKSTIDFKKVSGWLSDLGYNDYDTDYVSTCNTMAQVAEYIMNKGGKDFFNLISKKVIHSVRGFVKGKGLLPQSLNLRVILVSSNGDILADVS